MDCRWIVDGLSMDCRWVVDGLSMGCRWIVDGLSMDCRWIVDGLSMDCRWIVNGLSMDCRWIVDGYYTFWSVRGGLLKCTVQNVSGFKCKPLSFHYKVYSSGVPKLRPPREKTI